MLVKDHKESSLPLLSINSLQVSVESNIILKDFSLSVSEGEVHVIMGPNGSGKSTLSHVLAGKDGYNIIDGKIDFNGEDLLSLTPEERACKGMFLGFQYPVEIPGVPSGTFLKEAVNSVRKYRGEAEYDAMQFLSLIKDVCKTMDISDQMLRRPLNVGFSGGEKKRHEILQMALLEPSLAILDETDSGLDIDALRTVANGINGLLAPNRSVILITHYQRMLEYIKPDFIHILYEGKIVLTGGMELVETLEKDGYAGLELDSAKKK